MKDAGNLANVVGGRAVIVQLLQSVSEALTADKSEEKLDFLPHPDRLI